MQNTAPNRSKSQASEGRSFSICSARGPAKRRGTRQRVVDLALDHLQCTVDSVSNLNDYLGYNVRHYQQQHLLKA